MHRVAVFNSPGSATVAEILDAAADWCDPVIVNATGVPWPAGDREMISEVADTVDAAGLGLDELCAELEKLGVDGVVGFTDLILPFVARVAERLGLPYHDTETATALTNKAVQRRRLAEAGLRQPRVAPIRDERDIAAAVAAVGFPAVLKPGFGAGSANVFAVDTIDDLHEALRGTADDLALPQLSTNAFTFDRTVPWQLEERLAGGAHPAGDWLGDYVSVESVALGPGDYWHFWITDRLPLTWPFRETGLVSPTLLPPGLHAEVLAEASRALSALGVRTGVSHTELKLTPDGPRVIEVNGRLGGLIGQTVSEVSDIDPTELALRAAAGNVVRKPVTTNGFVIAYLIFAPQAAGVLTGVPDPAQLRRIPGVWRIDAHLRVGERTDYRAGTVGRIQTIWARGDDLNAVVDSYHRVVELATAGTTYAPAGELAVTARRDA